MADLTDFAAALERAAKACDVEHWWKRDYAAVPEYIVQRADLARDVVALLAAWEAATAERDEARAFAEATQLPNHARVLAFADQRERELKERVIQAEAERDWLAGHVTALREALERIACESKWNPDLRIAREALAGLDEPPEQQEARPSQTDGTREEGEPFLPWTNLTLKDARRKLAGWHFAKEALSSGQREILYVAEALLRELDSARPAGTPNTVSSPGGGVV